MVEVGFSALSPQVLKGVYQAGGALLLALIVLILTRVSGQELERELGLGLTRGFVQVVAAGLLVGVVLTAPIYWSGLVLVFMLAGATVISKKRGEGMPEVGQASFVAITIGAGTTITTMSAVGVIEPVARSLVPIGSLVIANAMKINSLALDRLKEEIESNRDSIEAGLALGGGPAQILRPHVRKSVRASLIPTVDSLKSLGLVWIPGVMAGMILSGENPIYAGLYQFVIVSMMFAAGGLTTLTGTYLVSRAMFTDAKQLRELGDLSEDDAQDRR